MIFWNFVDRTDAALRFLKLECSHCCNYNNLKTGWVCCWVRATRNFIWNSELDIGTYIVIIGIDVSDKILGYFKILINIDFCYHFITCLFSIVFRFNKAWKGITVSKICYSNNPKCIMTIKLVPVLKR